MFLMKLGLHFYRDKSANVFANKILMRYRYLNSHPDILCQHIGRHVGYINIHSQHVS